MGPEGTLAHSVEGFLAAAAVERGLAPRTLEAYARDLARFASHLARRGVAAPGDVRREHVTGFVASLERQGLAARSRARALVAVRRWLRHAGAAAEDPCAGVALPRVERRLPRVLRPDETAALIDAADPRTPLGLRDRAMLEVLYGSGLRVSELVGLPLSGVDARDVRALREFGLPPDDAALQRPLVGMVSRMVDQKGFDLVARIAHRVPSLDAAFVARIPCADLVKQAAIDLKDDLQMTRQHQLKMSERPFLKRFGEQGVVSVRQSLLCDLPCLVPGEMRFVEQNPHQLHREAPDSYCRPRHRRVDIPCASGLRCRLVMRRDGDAGQ